MDFTTRPYQDRDADGLAAHINAIDTHFGGHPRITANNVREWMSGIGDLSRDTRIAVTPDGTVIGSGIVHAPPKGGMQASMNGGVIPGWRGRGIGRDLLARQLARVTEMHEETAPDTDWLVRLGADQQDASALRLYERFGFTPHRFWFEMQAPTTGFDTAALLPIDGFRVRTAEGADGYAIYEAHMEAFQDHFGSERRSYEQWSSHSVGSSQFRADLSRLAYDGDEIAAYVLCFDEAAADWLYVGQVGTRRPWRGQGLATGLIAEVLTDAATAGKISASLGVDATSQTGAVGVYERLGFVVTMRSVSYSKPLPATA